MNVLMNFHEFPENVPIINNTWMYGFLVQLYQSKEIQSEPTETHAIITSSDLFYTKPVMKLNTLH